MESYGRDFIKKLAGKTKHIRGLIKKSSRFHWTDKCQQEFDGLKEDFQGSIMMHHFNPKLDTFLEVDASQSGISAMLMQDSGESRNIVAVASRVTTPVEARISQLD